eukprot:TRINITY_DN7019_c0_g1_i1.p1 TRINITY_DN7019_c0_g1~~TRINITY_DN7019_c0_g1_i1.p1  ORF type:complete len:1235 (+),score=150.61 TRINITY_DN7019_c0_g1_i1:26-3706(+)
MSSIECAAAVCTDNDCCRDHVTANTTALASTSISSSSATTVFDAIAASTSLVSDATITPRPSQNVSTSSRSTTLTSSATTDTRFATSTVAEMDLPATSTSAPDAGTAIEQSLGPLIEVLTSSDEPVLATTQFGVTLAVPLQASASNSSHGSYVPFMIESLPVAVSLPPVVLELEQEGPHALLMTSTNGSATDLPRAFTPGDVFNQMKMMAPAVDISLFSLNTGSARTIENLSTPILLRISVDAFAEPVSCAYWKQGEGWSTESVGLASAEDVRFAFGPDVNTSGVWCRSSHLSVFSIVQRVLLSCTNLPLLSGESLRVVTGTSSWRYQIPFLTFLALLIGLCICLLAGVMLDFMWAHSGFWRDEYFFTPTVPRRLSPGFSWRRPCASLGHKAWLLGGWLRHFKPCSRHSREQLVLNTLVRHTLSVTENLVCVDERTLAQHVWGSHGWVAGSMVLSKSAGFQSMAANLEATLPEAFASIGRDRVWSTWSLFASAHPVISLRHFSLQMSAKKRAVLLTTRILGSMMISALLSSASGDTVVASGESECPISDGSFERLVLVASLSMVLNAIPNIVIADLAKRSFVFDGDGNVLIRKQQLRDKTIQASIFWFVSLGIIALQLAVLLSFLANLRLEDSWKWNFSFAYIVSQKLFLMPLLKVVWIQSISECAIRAMPAYVKELPEKLGLVSLEPEAVECNSVEHLIIQRLANRGITLWQLIDFYELLGTKVMTHYVPAKSTTHDVVRSAIIPTSRRGSESYFAVAMTIRSGSFTKLDDAAGQGSLHSVGQRCLSNRQINISKRKPTLAKFRQALSFMSIEESREWQKRKLACEICIVSHAGTLKWRGSTGYQVLDTPSSVAVWNFETSQVLHPDDMIEFYLYDSDAEPWGEASVKGFEVTSSVYKGNVPLAGKKLEEVASALDLGTFALSVEFTATSLLELAHSRATLEQPWSADVTPPDSQTVSSACGDVGYAYATLANGGEARLAQKMVTHNWGNIFNHTLSSIIADALMLDTYDSVSDLLIRDLAGLRETLHRRGVGEKSYWICAFSVNQHAGICGTPPPHDSLGFSIEACTCRTSKHTDGALSEMNKFDQMMAFLKRNSREQRCKDSVMPRFCQVVAVDVGFVILSRVWCIAELVQAKKSNIPQTLKIHSEASQEACLEMLQQVDVREAQASFSEDKAFVLSKIDDIDGFNEALKALLFHELSDFLPGETAAGLIADVVLEEVVAEVA